MTAAKNPRLSGVISIMDASKARKLDPSSSEDVTSDDMPAPQNDTSSDTSLSFRDRLPNLDDTQAIRFTDLGDWTGEKPNTISARYFPKVIQAHEGLPSPSLQSSPGKPTGYAAKAIAEFLELNKDLVSYRKVLEERYLKPQQTEIQPKGELAAPATYQPVKYQPSAQSLVQQLHHQSVNNADTRLSAIARASLAIEMLNTRKQQLRDARQQEIYDQTFAEECERLGNEAEAEIIRQQAQIDAQAALNESLQE